MNSQESQAKHGQQSNEPGRSLGYNMARELTEKELNEVAGGLYYSVPVGEWGDTVVIDA